MVLVQVSIQVFSRNLPTSTVSPPSPTTHMTPTTPTKSTPAPRPSSSTPFGRKIEVSSWCSETKHSRWWWLNIYTNELKFHRFAIQLHIVVSLNSSQGIRFSGKYNLCSSLGSSTLVIVNRVTLDIANLREEFLDVLIGDGVVEVGDVELGAGLDGRRVGVGRGRRLKGDGVIGSGSSAGGGAGVEAAGRGRWIWTGAALVLVGDEVVEGHVQRVRRHLLGVAAAAAEGGVAFSSLFGLGADRGRRHDMGWALLPFCFGLYFALLFFFFSSFPLLLESTRLSTELFNPKPNQHASNQRTLATERFASRKKTREAHLN